MQTESTSLMWEGQTAAENAVREKYRRLTLLLIARGLTVTTMESCTGGLVASLLTDTEGSSAVIQGAFVTYGNEAKRMQGVPAAVIERFGIYSEETAAAMAAACRKTYRADIGIGVTGSFGNVDPNNADSVPGEVCFAVETAHGVRTERMRIPAQPARLAYKLAVADRIADRVFEELEHRDRA